MEHTEMANAIAQIEVPKFVVILRAAIRPVITLALTATFIFLLAKGVYGFNDTEHAKAWQEMLTVFLAVYGPIVGFWFGQQTAMKQR